MNYLIKSIMIEYGEEAAKEVSTVTRVIRSKVVAKNLFGWRTYINDVLIDLVEYMIKTDFQYSGGAYVACGMQAAIDATRYCNAQKRRGNYETISIHLIENFVAKDTSYDYALKADELLEDIKKMFDEEAVEGIRDLLIGKTQKLSKEVLAKCKTPEFMEWLKNYRS